MVDKKVWKDSFDGSFYLTKRGSATLAFRSEIDNLRIDGYLLNVDIPALIGALVKHLYELGDHELLVESAASALKEVSSLETVEAWQKALGGPDEITKLIMQTAIQTFFSREE